MSCTALPPPTSRARRHRGTARTCLRPRSPDRRARHHRPGAILRVLEECPGELLELRATLLQEHVWPQRRRSLVVCPRSQPARTRRRLGALDAATLSGADGSSRSGAGFPSRQADSRSFRYPRRPETHPRSRATSAASRWPERLDPFRSTPSGLTQSCHRRPRCPHLPWPMRVRQTAHPGGRWGLPGLVALRERLNPGVSRATSIRALTKRTVRL